MKILYLHQYYNNKDMIGSTRSYEFSKRLVESGHSVTIITSHRNAKKFDKVFETFDDGIKVIWIPANYSNKLGFYARVISFLKFSFLSTLYGLKIPQYDIVFATSTPLTIAIPGLICSKIKRKPLVFEVRDLWPEIPIALGILKNKFLIKIAKWLERTAYKNSEQIIALSEGMKDGVLDEAPNANVTVIPNSADNFNFNNLDQKNEIFSNLFPQLKESFIVSYCGTVGKVNNVDFLVNLAKETLKHTDYIKFLIVGDGVFLENVKKSAIEAGVFNVNVFFHPPMKKNDVFNVFNASSMCTNLVENNKVLFANSANKYFDSLAAGKPILINHGGWMKEEIERHNHGICLWNTSLDQAAQELITLSKDPITLGEMGARSKRLAIEKYSRDFLFKKFENLLINSKK